MTISLIAAASTNNVIGKNNTLPWHLPNDMKFFKNTTWAMPVIMGRKTYESFAGQPLPGRFNFVITSHKNWNPGNEKVKSAETLAGAIGLAKETDCREAFLIGGGQVYKQGIEIADKIYLTRVHVVIEGDTYFPIIDEAIWNLMSDNDFPADEKHAYAYSFQVWTRKERQV